MMAKKKREVKQRFNIAGDSVMLFLSTQSCWMDPAPGKFSLREEHSAASAKTGLFLLSNSFINET